MELTVGDLYRFPEFSGMKLIAGESGLGRPITYCGILDYEFDRIFNEKYYNYNYRVGNFLTLTSFQYAKDNEFLILDAVKRLSSKGGSGLIVRNVYHLNFSDAVIKYADRAGFPIFLLNDNSMFFENIIITVHDAVERYHSADYRNNLLREILEDPEDEARVRDLCRRMNPHFRQDCLALYARCRGEYTEADHLRLEGALLGDGLLAQSDALIYMDRGLLLIHTAEVLPAFEKDKALQAVLARISTGEKDFSIGISARKHFVHQIGLAAREAMDACRIHETAAQDTPYVLYERSGSFQILFPFADSPELRAYSERLLLPLEEYDVENGASLLETLTAFVRCAGDLTATSETLAQHVNTVRNKLKRIRDLAGCDPLSFDGYEQLSLAVKIRLCAEKA